MAMLFRSNRGYVTSSEYVEFYMDDLRTPAGVPCRVSREALEDRVGRDGHKSSGLLQSIFEGYRTEIEKIAADKHAKAIIEAGGYVLVATEDLNP